MALVHRVHVLLALVLHKGKRIHSGVALILAKESPLEDIPVSREVCDLLRLVHALDVQGKVFPREIVRDFFRPSHYLPQDADVVTFSDFFHMFLIFYLLERINCFC